MPSNPTINHKPAPPSSFPRRIAAVGLVGVFAFGAFGAAPALAVTTANPSSIVATAASKGEAQYVAINQFTTGLPTMEVDCGPAAAAMAMLAEGYTPADWDPNNHAPAVAQLRADTGTNGTTVESQVAAALKAQDVPTQTDTDFNGALDKVRNGKSAILNGYMTQLPYTYNSGNPEVIHWILVTNYDAETNTFTVMDSNDGSKRDGITQDQLAVFQNSLQADWQYQVVVG